MTTRTDAVIATGVSLDEYMAHYAAAHCEWVEGAVIQMSPVSGKHDELSYYLRQLLSAYFELRPIGRIRSQPFVLRLSAVPDRRREPDLMVILNENPHALTETVMDGPPDICIEIVSEESIERDHGTKFSEYERGGVPGYWIIDPLRDEARFYRLDSDGRYHRQEIDADGHYRTPTLPDMALHVATLWADSLPGPAATARAIAAMLGE
jgi:Uma2 family endonuclease